MEYYVTLQSESHREAWTSVLILMFTKFLKLNDERVKFEKNYTYNNKSTKINLNNNLNVYDVTGGIKRKVEEATKIAGTGKDVIFINGLNSTQIQKALQNEGFKGTIFKGKKYR